MQNDMSLCNAYLEPHLKTIGRLCATDRSLVAQDLISLQRGLTGGRDLVGVPYMQDNASLDAYLLYYWPVSYAQMWCVLWAVRKELCTLIENCTQNGRPLCVADIGCGPAPASAALCDMVRYLYPSEEVTMRVLLADSSSKALSAARELFAADFASVPVQTVRCDMETDFASVPIQAGQTGVILMEHSLNELYASRADKEALCTRLLLQLSEALLPDGLLAVCEPALLGTSRELISIRNRVLESGKLDVLSPCLKNSRCPVLSEPDRTCHAEVDWNPPPQVLSLAKQAGLDRRSVKMSYFVLTPSRARKPEMPEGSYLVTSDPMLNKAGRIRYLLCDGESRRAFSAKKGDTRAAETGFFDLRRYDAISIQNPELRENGALGFGKDTKICYTGQNNKKE